MYIIFHNGVLSTLKKVMLISGINLVLVLPTFAVCLHEKTPLQQGECYEREGNTNLAQAAYERAILEDTNSSISRLKLAELYNSLEMKAQSNLLLSDVNEKQLTPQQRTSLAALQKDTHDALSTLRLKAIASIGYDSNININPVDDTILTTTGDQLNSIFSRVTADVSYLHDLSEVGGWFLRGDGNFYYQDNFSAHDYDVLYGRIYTGGGYRNETFSLYIPLYYDRLNYLNRDLLQESGLRPDLNIELSSTLILDLNAMYSARRYIQSADQIRDDDLMGAGLGLFWLDEDNLAYLKAHFVNYSARAEIAPDFTNKELYYLMIGGVYSLTDTIDLYGDYQFRFGDFEPTVNGHRQDGNHDMKVAVEYTLTHSFRLRGQYRYLYNDSNFDPAKYQKSETIFGLVYNY